MRVLERLLDARFRFHREDLVEAVAPPDSAPQASPTRSTIPGWHGDDYGALLLDRLTFTREPLRICWTESATSFDAGLPVVEVLSAFV